MKWINLLVISFMLVALFSCHKPQTVYQNRVAQDASYRMGKWYSVSDTMGDASIGVNSLLDTIWFINDTLAGYTGFVPYQPRVYVFWKTYFSDASDIVYLAPNVQNPSHIDVISHQCAMSGDTFVIWWDLNAQPPQVERYLKMK